MIRSFIGRDGEKGKRIKRLASKNVNAIKSGNIRFGIKTAIGAGLYLTSLFMVINGSYNPFLYFRF